MTRQKRLEHLSRALKSDLEWVKMSLVDYDSCEDLIWSSNKRIAEQMVKLGFTHLKGKRYVRSNIDDILTMLEDAE